MSAMERRFREREILVAAGALYVAEQFCGYALEALNLVCELVFTLAANSVERIAELTNDNQRMHSALRDTEHTLQAREARLGEIQIQLHQAQERHGAAEHELARREEYIEVLELRLHSVEALEAKLSSLENDKSQLQKHIDQLREERERTIEKMTEDQQEFQLKQKQNARVIKELQVQLATQRKKPTTEPEDSPEAQNVAPMAVEVGPDEAILLARLADQQERIWLLETAKKSYEHELGRLARELSNKNAIIHSHFATAARETAKRKGKFAAALFTPTNAEVESELQKELEQAIHANIQLTAQLGELERRVSFLEGVVARAELEGFCVDGDDDSRGSDAQRDEFFE
jgi:DNA repair exonuclease SbcCD ATPase subunit